MHDMGAVLRIRLDCDWANPRRRLREASPPRSTKFTYDEEGAFLNGTFADYLVPTVSEIPEVEILHIESPSPLTPLGAKGLAEGNCMSTPVCVANAIADALGVDEVELPSTPRRIHAMMMQGAKEREVVGRGALEA